MSFVAFKLVNSQDIMTKLTSHFRKVISHASL